MRLLVWALAFLVTFPVFAIPLIGRKAPCEKILSEILNKKKTKGLLAEAEARDNSGLFLTPGQAWRMKAKIGSWIGKLGKAEQLDEEKAFQKLSKIISAGGFDLSPSRLQNALRLNLVSHTANYFLQTYRNPILIAVVVLGSGLVAHEFVRGTHPDEIARFDQSVTQQVAKVIHLDTGNLHFNASLPSPAHSTTQAQLPVQRLNSNQNDGPYSPLKDDQWDGDQ